VTLIKSGTILALFLWGLVGFRLSNWGLPGASAGHLLGVPDLARQVSILWKVPSDSIGEDTRPGCLGNERRIIHVQALLTRERVFTRDPEEFASLSLLMPQLPLLVTNSPESISRFYRIIRMVSFLLVTVAGLLLAWEESARGIGWGLVSWTLFWSGPGLVAWSLDATPWAGALVFVVGCWDVARRIYRDPTWTWAVGAGTLGGIAAGCVPVYGACLLLPVSGILARGRFPGAGRQPGRTESLRLITLTLLAGFSTYLVIHFLFSSGALQKVPPSVLHVEDLLRVPHGPGEQHSFQLRWSRFGHQSLAFFANGLVPAVGLPILFLAIVGLLAKFRNARWSVLIAVPGALSYGCIMGLVVDENMGSQIQQQALFVVPFVTGAAVHGLRFLGNGSLPRILCLLLVTVGLSWVQTGSIVGAYAAGSRGVGSRIRARQWLLDQVPTESTIGLSSGEAWIACPPLDSSTHALVLFSGVPDQGATPEHCLPKYWLSVNDHPLPRGYTRLGRFAERGLFGEWTSPTGEGAPLTLGVRAGSPDTRGTAEDDTT